MRPSRRRCGRNCPGSAATGQVTSSSVRRSGPARSTSAGAARSGRSSSSDSSRATGTQSSSTSRTASLTIEHVLPQTLSEEWREHLASLGQDPDEVHQGLVHTLGNLTLTAFNGTLSNNPFERKRQIYSASHLELNRALAEQDAWGREQILARADELADHAIAIWPSPLPGAPEPPGGFDWSRINAAIAAIPRGRWTTYGELAQLGGTAAMPVGQHIANTPGLGNAYRVLGSDGKPRPDFRWDSSRRRAQRDRRAQAGRRPLRRQRRRGPVAADHRRGIVRADRGPRRRRARRRATTLQPSSWDSRSGTGTDTPSNSGIPDDRLAVGRKLVNLLSEAIAEKEPVLAGGVPEGLRRLPAKRRLQHAAR